MVNLVLAIFIVCATSTLFIDYLIGFDPHCHFTRADAVDCIVRYVDSNGDRVVTVAEVDAARERYTGIALRLLERVVAWRVDVSSAKILRDCGANGTFSEDNFLHGPASKTCLPTQYALCMFSVACKHIAKQEEKPRVKPARW